MKAIRTRYYGPTDTCVSHFTASDSDGHRAYLPYDYDLDADENQPQSLTIGPLELLENDLVGGGYGNDMYWTMVPRIIGYKCAVCGKTGPEHGHWCVNDPSTHLFKCGEPITE